MEVMREAVLLSGAGLAVGGLLESALGNPCSEPALRPAAARPRSPSRPSAWCLVGRPRGRLWSNLDPLLRLEGAPSHKQQRNCIRQGNLPDATLSFLHTLVVLQLNVSMAVGRACRDTASCWPTNPHHLIPATLEFIRNVLYRNCEPELFGSVQNGLNIWRTPPVQSEQRKNATFFGSATHLLHSRTMKSLVELGAVEE